MPPFQAVLVDDEPLARRRLDRLLAREPDVRVVGEAGDGGSAVRAIRELRPDLVFLDVRMPDLDGFGVMEELGDDAPPWVIFATAYDDYAVRAFEVEATDYLVKPVDGDRLRAALDRITRRDRAHAIPPRRLLLRDGDTATLIATADIDWIEADGNYARIHVAGACHLERRPLRELEATLDRDRFARIHRSTIVNLDRVRRLTPGCGGGHLVHLVDGTELTLSRRFGRRLFERIGSTL